MAEENISQELRLKQRDETKNYLTEEINHNELIVESMKRFAQL